MSDDWQDRVLAFWFDELEPEQWFKRDGDVDAAITTRFSDTYEALRGKPADELAATARTALAAVIVLDQFARNMFRDSARAFESDPLALEVANAALDCGLDRQLGENERHFLYMPFMHSERLADQDRAVALFEALGKELGIKYAHLHRDVIVKFGRFPHRNAALGRPTTAAEQAHLDVHGGF
ncbi:MULTISPECIES: DUF924 family protein [unclassified Roseitalea]|uniref:DUF924 family protein n=1 Tax=unclassified Roseitalea TaxID=2639107 RepID=UPI00273EECC1|nr:MULTISPECIES: DUF924 family protein [unclassified Roseitalea]